MLSSRQEELLKLIVEDYVKTAKPVSSNALCEILNVSSATIRNEMASLKDEGLLEKTHISSGRVPSEKGYRYYVDNIMKPKELTGDDILKLQTIVRNSSLVIEDYIAKSVEIVSEMTNLTAVVLGSSSNENKISKVEVVPFSENNLVAIIITDKGHIEHKNIIIEEKVSIDDIKKSVDIINKFIIGTPIDEVPSKLEFEVKPIISQYIERHEALYNAFYNAFSDFTTPSYTMKGTKNILMQPEFNDVDKMRDIISKFEDKEIVSNIKETDKGINIYIGSENEFDDDVTIIKTKYNINGEEGTIALIGPKRMEYSRVISLLDYITKNINNE
ncbi:MAG TPA: heat-inducible transcriptional repressor HrcA [Bacilli bacterium]|nr:heat-inducible transcriptional repressor HrcA [Bacilli bacterium]